MWYEKSEGDVTYFSLSTDPMVNFSTIFLLRQTHYPFEKGRVSADRSIVVEGSGETETTVKVGSLVLLRGE